MNCREGDLAVIVSAPREVRHHLGKVVKCVRLTKSWDGVPCWLIEAPFADVVLGCKGTCEGIADRDLRPIRDQSGEDETLQWADVPNKETA